MAELTPYPFAALVRRMFRELERLGAIFDLPARSFFLGDERRDFGVEFHGRRAATPFGPAAGPHTQMAQNILLSWLCGARILELKTVQVLDELQIPRPCIDMQTVGYNVEWSQELKLEAALEEYVKGSMLIEILTASGVLPFQPGSTDTLFDMSVGYDLEGIRSTRVGDFIRGMLDARTTVDRLRAELRAGLSAGLQAALPAELARLRDLDFRTRIADTVTLSTFHGCPPDEIERIIDYLQEEFGLHCIVKLNPTLLGPDETRHLLRDVLGYREIEVPPDAFERDTTWEQAAGIIERLRARAAARDLGFGVKFTNTLVVGNHRDFFPKSEKEMYLSGAPLHVLAMHLVRRCRRQFGGELPISFSAGIQRVNFPDAVALGLVPVTVCTDLLKKGGYGRARGYFDELGRRMDAVGATSIDQFVRRAFGRGDQGQDDDGRDDHERETASARSHADACVANTETYVPRATADPRYSQARNARPPRKVGSRLQLFDCLSCDICLPVCPNDANFTFVMPRVEIPLVRLQPTADGWQRRQAGSMTVEASHQIGNIADFCNACGNCDIFCPEDGGPYVLKPRFFITREAWRDAPLLDGFHFERAEDGFAGCGRFGAQEYFVVTRGAEISYSGLGFEVRFDRSDPEGTLAGRAEAEIDLTYYYLMHHLERAIFADDAVNYINCRS